MGSPDIESLARIPGIRAALQSPNVWCPAWSAAESNGLIGHDGTFRTVGTRKAKHANWRITKAGRAVLRALEADRG